MQHIIEIQCYTKVKYVELLHHLRQDQILPKPF